jgi:hypothetical protein
MTYYYRNKYYTENETPNLFFISATPPDGLVITIEQYNENDDLPHDYLALIDDAKFLKDDKFLPLGRLIISTAEKAKMILSRFFLLARDFYVDPKAIDPNFLEWYAKRFPMDILSLPLENINREWARKALIIAIDTLKDPMKYSGQWISDIFRDMPTSFKDEEMKMKVYERRTKISQ